MANYLQRIFCVHCFLLVSGLPIYAQADEEKDHAMKMANYLLDQGADVKLQAIDAPETKFASVLTVTEASLAHEKLITGQINDIANLAMSENDHATRKFIHSQRIVG